MLWKLETSLHEIATSLQSAAEGYMSLASHIHKLNPYELPQVIAQIPPPPIDVPMTIRKALTIDGKDKVINVIQIFSSTEPIFLEIRQAFASF